MTIFIMSIIIIIKVDSLNENITVSDTGGQEKFKRVEENFNALQTALRDIQSDNSNKIQKVADIGILLLCSKEITKIYHNNERENVNYFTVHMLWYFPIPPDWTSAVGKMKNVGILLTILY